jgi:D-3-phosphoglycerate dehydrogenase
MDVIGYDPHLATFPETIRRVSLSEIYSSSDFISIHVHLLPETDGMVNREAFACMKRGAVFINTARGALVDEDAMLAALQSGQLGAAGVDVLNGEPDTAQHPLVVYARTHENLLITPHCGGFSPDAVRKVCAHAAGKIRRKLLEH